MAKRNASSNERAEKLQKLHDFRFRMPHMSKTALHTVLASIKEEGSLELSRREHMHEALSAELAQHNAYGPLIETLHLCTKSGQQTDILLCNGLSLLHGAVRQGGSYCELVENTLQRVSNSPDHLWNLILYTDEAVPGNPLAHLVTRKAWCIYISFLEFGEKALSKEAAWLTIGACRSKLVSELEANLSQLVASALQSIFCRASDPVQGGVVLKTPAGRSVRLFFRMGLFLNDGGAHKFVWCVKADSGCRFCVLCTNVFMSYSAKEDVADDYDEDELDADDDARDGLVCGFCKKTDLRLASDLDILATVDRLAARRATCTLGDFKMWEKASGFNYEPRGLLMDRALRSRGLVAPASQYCHDWMHTTCCSGTMQRLLFLLFSAASKQNVPAWQEFREYLQLWVPPAAFGGRGQLSELFSKSKVESYKKVRAFKCQASDMLQIYPVAQHYCLVILMPANVCKKECEAFLAMCLVLAL